MSIQLKCPLCLTAVFIDFASVPVGQDVEALSVLQHALCPSCGQLLVFIDRGKAPLRSVEGPRGKYITPTDFKRELLRPRAHGRPPCAPEVPSPFRDDYTEACRCLPESPKAAAALARRCLQHVLREKAGVKRADLAVEIQEVLDGRQLPSHLAEAIDSVRNVGNFAAHPIKSTSSGEVVPVEPGEAEWNLDVLEGLFDFYFVQPEVLRKKREALNAKLGDAGKPPMK